MLHKHIDPEDKLQNLKLSPVRSHPAKAHKINSLAYGSRYATEDIPKYTMPESSTEAQTVYQLIHDEMELDGRPNSNLASFVHTWMEPEANKLIIENMNKNLADQDEYPATMRIHARCISVIGNLWNAKGAVGTSTVGSSEAIHLGGLAMKKRWQAKMKSLGKDASNPNIIMGSNAQVALEKFAGYFDVECRKIPVSAESHYCLDICKAAEACDENTIGVFVILGSTYTGHFEDVEGMSKELDRIQEEKGWDIPIHVDAASGGFVAPFVFPNLKWSFDLPRVHSINASGHKFGLTYAGIGWVLWKNEDYLPKELIFTLTYLGSQEQTFTLNFSRPACFMIAQYYNFVRLGKQGYTSIVQNDLENARVLSRALEDSTYYEVVSDMHRPKGTFGFSKKTSLDSLKELAGVADFNPALPVVTFKLSESFKCRNPQVKQSAVSMLLRTRGWIVPNYSLPPAAEDVEILRIVVRESFSRELVDNIVGDLIWVAKTIEANDSTFDMYVLEHQHEAHKLDERYNANEGPSGRQC
ncbi:hypothetical protein FBU30_009734 [Linnemannia zychae]|nr:hypothetical protein FBU30_009734 [Linnemannia zychae]